MKTPVYDFLRGCKAEDALRLHMPGHKGKGIREEFSDICSFDITEIDGAGDLFSSEGIIAESEKNAAALFQTAGTFYSAGGSTLCIQTMLNLKSREGGRVLAARDCHKAFLNAAALLGLCIDWVYPRYAGEGELFGGYALADFEAALSAKSYDFVYITTVNYYGYIIDTADIAALCRRYGTVLLCDNAHGAHLAFAEEFVHPIAAGADFCCDSAHKTLPALTGAAYLHLKEEHSPRVVKDAMSIFGTTSPPYPIIASLDILNAFLEKECRARLGELVFALDEMKYRLSGRWRFCGDDPLHITIYSALSGLRGIVLAEILRENHICCEYSDDFCVILLFSATNTPEDVFMLERALERVRNPRIRLETMPYIFGKYPAVMPPRDVLFAQGTEVSPADAVGKICARSVIPCPPAFPLIAAGELVTEECAALLDKFGVRTIKIIP